VSNPIPQSHEGAVCEAVRSAGGWNATICAMTNTNDAQLGFTAQTLITYTIRSGTLAWVSASNVHSQICTPICGITFNPLTNPAKIVNAGKSSFLSNTWYGPAPTQYLLAGVVVNPCVSWTNGQLACYVGTIRGIPSII